MFTREHFYHVGSTEDLRHPMIEALITNFAAPAPTCGAQIKQLAFFEEPSEEYSFVSPVGKKRMREKVGQKGKSAVSNKMT